MKKHNKKLTLIFIVLLISVFANNLFSHEGGVPLTDHNTTKEQRQWSKMDDLIHMETMRKALRLSEEQTKKISKLGIKFKKKYINSKENYENFNEVRKEHSKQINEILNPRQRTKFSRYHECFGKFGWYGGCPYFDSKNNNYD